MDSKYIHEQIGNYRVVSELASGSFGRIYLAQHAYLVNRTVAIKLLHATHLGSSEDRESFLREAQFLERLKHSYILPMLDFGIHEGFPYLVTEYAPNGSLRDHLKRQGGNLLGLQESVSILTQIGQALQFAHDQNIIHRDIKPENILFNANNEALLADFGLATMLTTTSIKYVNNAGTPRYMAPEQFQGTVSKESDQYTLACVAYELVTGRHPFITQDLYAVGFKHLYENPTPPTQFNPNLPTEVERVILKAMAKQRTDRHPDVRAFIIALQRSATLQPHTLTWSQMNTTTLPFSGTSTSSRLEAPTISASNTSTSTQMGDRAGKASSVSQNTTVRRTDESDKNLTIPAITQSAPTNFWTDSDQPGTIELMQPIQSKVEPTPIAVTVPVQTEAREKALKGSRARENGTILPTVYPPTGDDIPPRSEAQRKEKRDFGRRWFIVAVACSVIVASVTSLFLFVSSFSKNITKVVTPSAVITAPSTAMRGSGTPGHKPGVATTAKAKQDRNATSTPTGAKGTSTPDASTPVPVTPTPTRSITLTPTPSPNPPPSLTVPFVYGNTGVQTSQSYSGMITVTVSGSGQADSQTAWSDAFYLYKDSSGNPLNPPQHTSCEVLYINGMPADQLTQLPPYNSSHIYKFSMQAPGGTINFAECDPNPTNDTGSYTITITTNGNNTSMPGETLISEMHAGVLFAERIAERNKKYS